MDIVIVAITMIVVAIPGTHLCCPFEREISFADNISCRGPTPGRHVSTRIRYNSNGQGKQSRPCLPRM